MSKLEAIHFLIEIMLNSLANINNLSPSSLDVCSIIEVIDEKTEIGILIIKQKNMDKNE